MNRVVLSLVFAAALLVASHLGAATVKLDAIAVATYNAADFGPPAVPLITDTGGNVLNPTVGQVYEVAIQLSVSDLEELPNGNMERGFASASFDMSSVGVRFNDLRSGWYLDPEIVDSNGIEIGGRRVPLWVDLCACGQGGETDPIAFGVDVPDFDLPFLDPRRRVGVGSPAYVGSFYFDYLGRSSYLTIDGNDFSVHDDVIVHPGSGPSIGDQLQFVPEPGSASLLLATTGAITACWHVTRLREIA